MSISFIIDCRFIPNQFFSQIIDEESTKKRKKSTPNEVKNHALQVSKYYYNNIGRNNKT